MVIEDPRSWEGIPVIRGTRIPVHQIAAVYSDGIPLERILKSCPSLTAPQVELASIYAKAVRRKAVQSGRNFPAGTKVVSVTRGKLKSRIAG